MIQFLMDKRTPFTLPFCFLRFLIYNIPFPCCTSSTLAPGLVWSELPLLPSCQSVWERTCSSIDDVDEYLNLSCFRGWAVTVQSHTQSLCALQGLLRTCLLIFMSVVSLNALWSFPSLRQDLSSLLSHHRTVEDGELLATLNGFMFTTTAKWRG